MRVLVTLAVVAIISLSACGPVSRPLLTNEQLEQRRSEQFTFIQHYMVGARDRVIERMAAEVDAQGPNAVYDMLILSGGGDYGAFGAGVLAGWGKVQDLGFQRPEFDMVTGVSTGALIAPFAFVGRNDDYDHILRLYTAPKKDWFSLRGLFFFLPGNESLTDNAGLRRDIEREINQEVLDGIVRGDAEGRILLVGTTNLDLGILHPWDLTTEARKVAASPSRTPKRFYDIIMASTAIPAVFPPVVIDGSLYVDGGTTSNILFNSDLRDEDGTIAVYRRTYRSKPLPKFRFWIIINNQLAGTPRLVEQSWLAITKSSVETAVRSSTIGALKQLSLQAELQRRDGLDVEFRYIAIPDSWRPAGSDPFDKATMQSLADLGRTLGANPKSWRTDIVSQPEASPIQPAAPHPAPVTAEDPALPEP